MKYQIFISYRRSDDSAIGKLLQVELAKKGYKVFFDIESMKAGKFDQQLYNVIDEVNDFIIIISKHSLDRCSNPEDWVRIEIEYALKKGKNIIPVIVDDFTWEDNLPESIKELKYYEGVLLNKLEYMSASIEKLSKLLKSEPLRKKRIIRFFLLIIIISAIFAVYFVDPVNTILSGVIIIKETNEKSEGEGDNEASSTEDELSQVVQKEYDLSGYTTKNKGTYVTVKGLSINGVGLYKHPEREREKELLPEAKCVYVMGSGYHEDQEWYYINFCEKKGLVRPETLRKISSSNQAFHLEGEESREAFTDKEKSTIYREPNPESEIIEKDLPYGTELDVSQLTDGWGKVKYTSPKTNEETEGWVNMSITSYYYDGFWQVEICNGKKSKSINVRKTASMESETIGKLKVGKREKINNFKDGFGKILYKGKAGWIKLHYATPCGDDGIDSEDLHY